MMEGINNIFKRINEIQTNGRNLNTAFKPEMVKEFENMYNEAVSKNTGSSSVSSAEAVHPYLKQKEVSAVSNVDSTENKTLINQAVAAASKKYGITEDLINAVIKVESNYDKKSVSPKGAMGLMQLMPETALDMGVDKPFDVFDNVEGGTRYLKLMLDKYDGSLEKALAAYNAGPQKVDAADGIPDIEETKNYVKQIKKILYK
jgi:soluble lytic murein transglycosylase-like protein